MEGENARCEKENGMVRTPSGGRSGILRLEVGKPRRTSMELKHFSQVEPSSPQLSVLSVTFADESVKSEASPRAMDKVHFPQQPHTDDDNSDEEDYSASVTAIMQRRASTRRSKKRGSRRGSSPFSPDILPETENGRRRSSVFTSSSGDTAITMEDSFTPSITQEQIFENLKLHKEVLSSVKMQPWNMRKKLRLVVQAKSYIKRHEGALQERLAQSHSTRDMLARCNIYLIKKWHRCKREAANLANWLIPWERRIKEIESHFGSVVASYFIFLRWMFWVNIVVAIIMVAFIAIPEMLMVNPADDPERKAILPEDKYNSTNFLTLWDFEGVFKYSPIFYGWYTNRDVGSKGYRLPLAYFFTGLAVYVYSFVATLRKMAKNSRMSKLSEKEDECIFSWKVFTGWDYMIGNPETATNRVASIVMGFKEALLEEAEKKREAQNWKIIGSRIMVWISVLGLLALSAFAVVTVVARSNEKEANSSMWRRNETTVVITLLTLFFPILFELLGYFEHYHPRKQLRLQLARIMVLNLLNLYSLMFALFGKISIMTRQLKQYKPNCTEATTLDPIVPTTSLTPQQIITFLGVHEENEPWPTTQLTSANLVVEIVANLTKTILPNIIAGRRNLTELLATAVPTASNTSAGFNLDFSHLTNAFVEFLNNISNETQWEDGNLSDATPAPTKVATSLFRTTWSNDEAKSSSLIHESTASVVHEAWNTSDLHADYRNRSHLRSLCWETMFGQELVKLTVMDLVMTVLSTLAIDFLRGLFVRYMNDCWCWDLEKRFPQYGDFKVAENILHLVNNQGMVWMGMFFSPGLVVLNVVKLYILMYLRSWAVLTCNVPHEIIFRASRSNNFYFALLLMMLFLCVLPVGYTIVWLEPSWHCGPFSEYSRIFHVFTKTIRKATPQSFHFVLDYVASPGIVIPLLVLLILIIYYLISLSNALREANNDLKIQLRRERTEERRKMFQIADKRHRNGSDASADTPFGKWKQLLHGLPEGKSFDETPKQEQAPPVKAQPEEAKGTLSKFILRAIRTKKQPTDDQGDATDTDQNSLPDDGKDSKRPTKLGSTDSTVKFRRNSSIEIKKSPVRNDSVGSNWSDNIPVITISKTESSECILESREEGDTKTKVKYMLKKQTSVLDREEVAESTNSSTSTLGKDAQKVCTGSPSVHTVDTNRTESSTEYKDGTFSS